MSTFDHPAVRRLVASALEEDVGRGDVTTGADQPDRMPSGCTGRSWSGRRPTRGRPRSASGTVMLGSIASMFHDANRGSSQVSDHPRNTSSVFAPWYRARLASLPVSYAATASRMPLSPSGVDSGREARCSTAAAPIVEHGPCLPQHFTANPATGLTLWKAEPRSLELEFDITNVGNSIYKIAKESEEIPN